MCAIVDANVIHEVFGSSRNEAGKRFFDWISSGKGRLVAGGQLIGELYGSSAGFRVWAQEAVLAGNMKIENENQVVTRTRALGKTGQCISDDPHIIALAQVSGARLLYSNDKDLQRDFKDKRLIDNPRGKIYTTAQRADYSSTHRNLLARRDLCAAAQF